LKRCRDLAALLVGAIARSSDDFPLAVEHVPDVDDNAFFAEVLTVKKANPITFGSDDCKIPVYSRGQVSRRVLFNCDVREKIIQPHWSGSFLLIASVHSFARATSLVSVVS